MRWRRGIRQICLTDLFLLGYLALALFYLIISLFFYYEVGDETSAVDVIIRTTAASVFGYFISGAFLHRQAEETPKGAEAELVEMEQAVISSSRRQAKRIQQQVTIIGSIGILSFMFLILLPAVGELPDSSVATISQLRDFVSGSVGLLIGHSTRGE